MEIAYTAHTETCTLLLDAGGICRSVLAASSHVAANGGARPTRIPTSAEKCVGAQYVATLDLTAPGGMSAMPKPGAQMLFARTDPNGRIALIRSAPVVRFEATPARGQSGVHERPDSTPTPANANASDEELTIPCEPPVVPLAPRVSRPSIAPAPTRSSVVPAPRSSVVPAPRSSVAPAPQRSSVTPAPAPRSSVAPAPAPRSSISPAAQRSSAPPASQRTSGVVPAGTARRTPIPPPPRAPRVDSRIDTMTETELEAESLTRPMYRERMPTPVTTPSSGVRAPSPSVPTSPTRRPSIVRVSATDWGDLETRPYTRATR